MFKGGDLALSKGVRESIGLKPIKGVGCGSDYDHKHLCEKTTYCVVSSGSFQGGKGGDIA